jgi:hypothetical protein
VIALPAGTEGGCTMVTESVVVGKRTDLAPYSPGTVIVAAELGADGTGRPVWRLLLAVPR